MSSQTIAEIMAAVTVLGTLGGVLEARATPGSAAYKIGAFLASLGVDLASLGKMFGGSASS